MVPELIKLIVLFLVIFDPLVSLGVFTNASRGMKLNQKRKIGVLAVSLAAGFSYLFLFFGVKVLEIFNTNLNDFKVGGGLVLAVLGINMVLGKSAQHIDTTKKGTSSGIAAIIATPLLTGPAAITAIILSAEQFGLFLTGAAVTIVLLLTGITFIYSNLMIKFFGPTFIQITSTLLGLVTLSWGVNFIRTGLGL